MKKKVLYTAFSFFKQLLDVEPMMTGAYQWIRVLDADVKTIHEVGDFEKYDVIHVNFDAMDTNVVNYIRNQIGHCSSTKIVVNQDYSPDTFKNAYLHHWKLMRDLKEPDAIFATSPEGQKYLSCLSDKNIFMIPHPCETDVLKRIKATQEFRHLLIFWHRYDNQCFTPAVVTNGLDISTTLAGYMQNKDNRKKYTKAQYSNIVDYMVFPDFVKLIKEAYMAYDPYTIYSYGRLACDCACLRTPMVGSTRNFASRLIYPDTSFDPYDVKGIRECLKRLMKKDGFYQNVVEQADYMVEYFNHKNSRERYKKMLDKIEDGAAA